MKSIILSFCISFLLVTDSLGLNSDFYDSSIGTDIGTTGIGITGVKKIDDKWGFRVGYHKYSKSFDFDDDFTKYDLELDLQDFQLMADYHIYNSSFKITFGLMHNGSDFTGSVKPANGTTITINDDTYNISDLGSVDVDIDFKNKIAPFIGIGWDTSFYKPRGSFGFTFNLGIIYSGKLEIGYNPNFITTDTNIINSVNSSLDKAKQEFNDNTNDFEYSPYISVGCNYKF
jgi:hypothetical protein